MPNDGELFAAISGATAGALIQTIEDLAGELRAHAGADFDIRLEDLKQRAVRRSENAALDGFPEPVQLFIVERVRATMQELFSLRTDGH